MAELSFTDGEICLQSQNLNEKDFKAILMKLNTTPRPRKCRRLEGLAAILAQCRRLEGLAAILAQLPPAQSTEELALIDNPTLGDAGMKHLHLIPESVKDLVLLKCGLTPAGVGAVCDFMSTNRSIILLNLAMNNIGVAGAKHISEMLKVNKTLRVLCVTRGQIGVEGFSLLANALKINHTLQRLLVGLSQDFDDAHLLALIPGLVLNQSVKMLDFIRTNVTETGWQEILSLLKHGNVHLVRIDTDGFPNIPTSLKHEIKWWLEFNICGRRVMHNKDSSPSDWFRALVKMNSHDEFGVDFSYELLRAKPHLFFQK